MKCELCGYAGWLYDHEGRTVCAACWTAQEHIAARARGENKIDWRKRGPRLNEEGRPPKNGVLK